MRAMLRVLAGLLLVTGGVGSLAGGVAAWAIGDERNQQGEFVTTLAPVQTAGYAVVVPDVAGVFSRHGVARLLGDGRLTINVRSASADDSELIVVALVPAADAARYLAGTARTEVSAVGYTSGLQPVQSIDVPGHAPDRSAPWETVEPVAGTVVRGGRLVTLAVDLPAEDPVALVIRRWDDAPGLSATITVGFAPASWSAATIVLLVAGGLGTLAGLGLLMLRRPWIDVQELALAEDDGRRAPARIHLQLPLPAIARRRRPSPPAPPRWRRMVPDALVLGRSRRRQSRHFAGEAVESPYVHTAT